MLHGQALKPGPSRAPASVIDLVERMLLLDPAARPSVAQVHATLMSLRGGAAPSTTARAPVPIRPPVVPRDSAPTVATGSATSGTGRMSGGASSVLRGKGVRIADGTTTTPPPDATPPHPATSEPASGTPKTAERPGGRRRTLVGKLLGKLNE